MEPMEGAERCDTIPPTTMEGADVSLPPGITGLHQEEKIFVVNAVNIYMGVALNKGYATRDGAFDNCYQATKDFNNLLLEYDVCSFIEHYCFSFKYANKEEVRSDLKRYPFRPDVVCIWHWASRVGDNLIIDWTARQFYPYAPFPAMWVDNTGV